MKKLAIAALVAASFFLGGFVASQSTSHFWMKQMESALLSGVSTEIFNAYVPLKELNAGRESNAVQFLSVQLDGALESRAVLRETFGRDLSETGIVGRALALQKTLTNTEEAEHIGAP